MSTTTNDQLNSNPICTVDPYQYIQIKLNPDGSITRLIQIPTTPATPDPASPSPVLSQDFQLNPSHKTYLRIFLPKFALTSNENDKKLPIIVYIHGGGFVILHADSCFHHDFCSELASHAPAIVVSVDYRLAPEHRLPAAYEDAVDALHWIAASDTNQSCDWLSKFGDFNNCFLMGTSAGGNIAYHAALRASDIVSDLHPLKFQGLILHHPFFGGLKRTESELRLINNPYLPLSGSDKFWELGLPVGADRDHEFCNPFAGDGLGRFEKFKEMGWRVLVTDCDGDPLVDRLVKFVEMLEGKGVKVKGHFSEGDYHGLEIMDPTRREPFFIVAQEFMRLCIARSS